MTEEEKKLQQEQNPQPQYSSPWQNQLEDTWKQIQNRPEFSYDVNADALWNQYKDQYIRQGQMAMEDTMGKAQTMTGGYGNSYAQSVGQQTYQDYLQGMTDKLPQFYQMAQDQYKAQNDDLLNRYGILSDLESKDYTRWMDDQAQRNWQTEWDEYIRRYNYEHGLGEFASTGGGGGGSSSSDGGSNNDQYNDETVDIAAEYLAMKRTGAKATETDKYLKAAVSAGLISQKDATELRNTRY